MMIEKSADRRSIVIASTPNATDAPCHRVSGVPSTSTPIAATQTATATAPTIPTAVQTLARNGAAKISTAGRINRIK